MHKITKQSVLKAFHEEKRISRMTSQKRKYFLIVKTTIEIYSLEMFLQIDKGRFRFKSEGGAVEYQRDCTTSSSFLFYPLRQNFDK
jgi:hypothetical protein